ncbi:hypothetical protein VTK73DRAFT_689 [Phialemonium thermophilum]|uniref:NADH-cytochrome b5 reductase n=1 Tax=Phialemonium thermophilum TaxID=223376 RepID=A0ABR3VUH4_9PEZI
MASHPTRPFLRHVLAASTMNTTVLAAAAVAGVGAYALYLRRSSSGDSSGAAKASSSTQNGTFSRFGFKSLRLHSSEQVNHDTKRLRFALPDPDATSGLSLTSAVLTLSFPNGGWIPCLRPYTPVNELDEKGFLELMVKHYPGGKQSTHLHSLKPGDTLTFAPLKGYAWTPNQHRHVALVAGGAGITPMYQLMRGILRDPADHTRITLVWGVNTDDDLFLRDELADLQRRFPGRLRTVYTVSRPVDGSPHRRGYVTRELLESAGLGAGKGEDGDADSVTKVLVCGPPPMEKALTGASGWGGKAAGGVLAELGYTKDQIHRF